MLKIESRGYELKFWRYASPVLALLLTGATSGLIFAVMGRPPGLTVYTFLVAPLLQQDGFAGAGRQGRAADHDGRRAVAGLPSQCLEHRHRRAVHPGRDLRRRPGAGVPRCAVLADLSGDDRRRRPGRHAERRPGRLVANPVQRQRDPDQPDVRLYHAVSTGVSRRRTLARPAGLRLSADRVVLRRCAGPSADCGHQRPYRRPAGAADRRRPVVHAGKISAGLSVPRARPGDPSRSVCRVQREPAGLDRHADQRRAGRAGRDAGGRPARWVS